MISGYEYVFSYMATKNSVLFDGMNVMIKSGPFSKKAFAFMNILHWYVYEDKTYRSIFISYTDEAGKQKKIQLFAQLGEPGFAQLVEGLNASIGAKGLNHLPKKEAFKHLKAADPKKVGALGAMIVILLITTISMYPGLRHYFDFGFGRVTVEQLIAGENISSRNLALEGYALSETLEETTTRTKSGSTSSTTKIFIPLVGENWDYDQPVHCVMKSDDLTDNEYYELMDQTEFVGVVRNIAWEGLEDDQAQFFRSEYGLDIADDCILFEVTGEEHNDALMFYLWLGINGLFLVIFGIFYLRAR